uniref:catalase family peroxidase n=1 Tax=Bradyrhizobium sp. (strain ORS 278) TaxID=114615 RepID=UPI00031883C2|nr:catalase family peroxidase [Bradyrhizobium sp. ORS 278]
MKTRSLVAMLAGLAFALPTVAVAEDAPVEQQLVDAMNKVFGVHAGFRANHAKGVVVEGKFKPSAEAAGLSKAALFSGAEIPVTVRFSDSTGVPNLPDGSGDANPHGMAVKFHLADGSDVDLVINSLKFFPVSTAAELRDLFLAIADSGPNAAKPTRLDQFIGSHPSAPAALGTIATPDSFADEAYFGVNAFVLVNKDGARQAVRWQMLPQKVVHLDKDDAARRAPDFLMAELPARLKQGSVTFRFMAQLAAAGDDTKDPAKPWPDDRKLVELGVLTIDKAVDDSDAAQKKLLFLPSQLTDGIEASDDPMIDIRSAAYAISFSRRNP